MPDSSLIFAAEPFAATAWLTSGISFVRNTGYRRDEALGRDPGELLRRADIALYRAKQRGRGRYRRFTPDMDASVKLRREMEMELRIAISRGELSVAYQPVVDTGTGVIGGISIT